jgi:putative restriction endonuclease
MGGGFFIQWVQLPVAVAWEAMGEKNGAASLEEMRTRVESYRRGEPTVHGDDIGCLLLSAPFFLPERSWVPLPDWKRGTQVDKGYRLDVDPGRSIWEQVRSAALSPAAILAEQPAMYGDPRFIAPRLGQGAFRLVVTDAYKRRCAITRERTLPVLEAAHIQPVANGGVHSTSNGILLRSDLHRLFDQGYLTVTPDLEVLVSKRLEVEFDNGKEYLKLHGVAISAPADPRRRPSAGLLEWHNHQVFVA